MKTRLLAAALIASCTWATLPAADAATIIVRTAPPPLRVEPVPAPRAGYTWANGYWDYRVNRYEWVPGRYVEERAGYAYNPPTWVENNGRWERREERWARRDADHDGIPNGADRHPENANRR